MSEVLQVGKVYKAVDGSEFLIVSQRRGIFYSDGECGWWEDGKPVIRSATPRLMLTPIRSQEECSHQDAEILWLSNKYCPECGMVEREKRVYEWASK